MVVKKIILTKQIRERIHFDRISKNISLKAVSINLGRSATFCSSVENGKIKSIDIYDLTGIFRIIHDISFEQASEILKEFELVETEFSRTWTTNRLNDKEYIQKYACSRCGVRKIKEDGLCLPCINELRNESKKATLTPREKEVYYLYSLKISYSKIASKLGISTSRVGQIIKKVKEKGIMGKYEVRVIREHYTSIVVEAENEKEAEIIAYNRLLGKKIEWEKLGTRCVVSLVDDINSDNTEE